MRPPTQTDWPCIKWIEHPRGGERQISYEKIFHQGHQGQSKIWSHRRYD
jgi:hypothetical protein